jgi:hypothetical protein
MNITQINYNPGSGIAIAGSKNGDEVTIEIGAKLSTEAGQTLQVKTDGLYVAAPNVVGGTVQWFADTTARDNYFTSHPDEKIVGVSVGVGDPLDVYMWTGTAWATGAIGIKGDPGDPAEAGIGSVSIGGVVIA